MTFVRPCECPSCPSNLVPTTPHVFHRIDLKFYRLPSYHMKMCMWFLIFVSAFFGKVMVLANSYLVPASPATSFVELNGNFAECFIMI